jgi:hypothetical protein
MKKQTKPIKKISVRPLIEEEQEKLQTILPPIIGNDENAKKEQEETFAVENFFTQEKMDKLISVANSLASLEESDNEDDDEEEDDMSETENTDLFVVNTKDFDGIFVKDVFLPKFVMSGNKVKEKGNLFLVFEGNPSIYVRLLKLLSAGEMSKLKITILGDDGTVQSTIVFPEPYLSAIDFGTLEKKREDERELKIEVDFYSFEIDGFKFSF